MLRLDEDDTRKLNAMAAATALPPTALLRMAAVTMMRNYAAEGKLVLPGALEETQAHYETETAKAKRRRGGSQEARAD